MSRSRPTKSRLSRLSLFLYLNSPHAGADAWIAQVRKARAALRAKAAEAYRRAAALNKARKRQTPPGQGDLFTSGGAV